MAQLPYLACTARSTAYGLCAPASTTQHEAGFESRIIETALANVDQNETRAAYNRAEYLAPRREMLAWWALQIAKYSVNSQ